MDYLNMKVAARRALTENISEFTLEPVAGSELPGFTPGAHLIIETPSGAMRRYSLVSNGDAPTHYVIAVKREAKSRGGSASMHDDVTAGTELRVRPPENTFELAESEDYLLIAGGIGVTPIYAMGQHLARAGKSYRVIYCTRSAEDTAYLQEMTELFGNKLTIHHDGGDPNKVFDFWDEFEEPKNMKVYCCGPAPMLEEIEAISGHWPEGRVIFEDFKPVEVVRADDVTFDVKLEKTGKTVTVPENRSILEAIRDAGVPTVSSCESGTCGTCKTKLIAGEADHRDMVLMDHEKEDTIMICVSRSKGGEELVLDI